MIDIYYASHHPKNLSQISMVLLRGNAMPSAHINYLIG